MSIQTLLPRDYLLRQLSICLDDDQLPVSYRTSRGKAKSRSSDTLLHSKFGSELFKYKEDLPEAIRKGKVDRCKYDCNFTIWKILDKLLSDDVIKEDFYHSPGLGKDIIASSDIVSVRLGNWISDLNSQKLRNRYDDQSKHFHKFMSLAIYFEETRDKFNNAMHKSVEKWKKDGSMGVHELPDVFSRERWLKYYQVGTIVMLKIRSRRGSYSKFLFTNTHFSRVIDYLKSCAILSYYLPDINGMDSSGDDYLSLLRYQCSIGLISPNGVGSVFKTARQIIFLMGDKSNVMGSSPDIMFENGLSGVKLKYGRDTAIKLIEISCDRKTALNLSNIFRIVPHPDADMNDVFESISGFKDANKVSDKFMPRFIGNVRKALYQSLSAQKMDVRLREGIGQGDMVESFVKSANSTSTPVSAVMAHGYVYWASVEFEEVRGLFDHYNQDIPVSNKSSAPDSKIRTPEIEKIGSEMKLSDYRDIRLKLRAINDVVSSLSGSNDLDFKNARKRFEEVIRTHESFEEKYLKKGIKIDDIPSEDLAAFVIQNKESSYTVLTEPKLGEVHKEVTRLFYMAEQALKIMTQVTERAVKKVISKASGISIVKSYRSRRKEIEEMLNAYTGINIGYEGGVSVIYISFDMSEFSKKFPQILVRAIGKVLSELTGEDWMSRIDLFFRAAVVYHNSRGFLGKKSGVTGGFEGFLNFLWTLAMKVVMDIATESTGVQGVLAVYSDDGLLRLYINGSSDDVRKKVETIKKVFKHYGLIFHLDKTAVSKELLEYLGLYGEKGMLLPTWVKEVMSIGKRKQTPGLETTYDKIQLWDSQCNAVVKSQGPHYPSMLIKTILSVQTLRRHNRLIKSSVLAKLTMIPSSAGGFRISSISESSLLSSIEGFSEFSSDLELLSYNDPRSSNAIALAIYRNLKEECRAEKSIPTGSFLQTDLPDTSGRGIAQKLVEEAGITSELFQDPMTEPLLQDILSQLRGCKNISQRLIKNMISEVPDMILYNKSIALVKSTAALKFVSRDVIKKAQRKDSRLCERSIEYWGIEIDEFSGKSGSLGALTFMDMVSKKLYPNYSFSPLRESPRTAIIPCDENPDIICTFEITANSTITNQDYREPSYKSLGAQLTPEIDAESSFNTRKRMEDRFVNSAARLVSTNSTLIHLYYILADAFDLPCPTLPASSVLGLHKSNKNFSSGSVHVILPVPYHALVNSRLGHALYQRLRGFKKRDRTTYIEASRIAGYLRGLLSSSSSRIQICSCESYLFKLRDYDRNTCNPVFLSYISAPKRLLSTRTTRTFTSMMVEETAQSNMLESVLATNGLIDCIADTQVVKAIMLSRTTKWLQSTISGSYLPRGIPFNIPDQWKKEIIMESCIAAAFTQSTALVRQTVQSSLSSLTYSGLNSPSYEDLDSDDLRMSINSAIVPQRRIFEEFNQKFRTITSSVIHMGLDERILYSIERLDIWDIHVLVCLLKFLRRKAAEGGHTIPTVVINSDTFANTKMSREVKNSIKSIVDSTLCRYIDRSRREEGGALDPNINFLGVLKQMIRPSGHRNTPFNKHMVMIELTKFELFIRDRLTRRHESVTPDDLKNYRIPRTTIEAIIDNNSVIAGRTDLTSGADMRNCLRNLGVLPGMLARSNYILRKLSLDSDTSYELPGLNSENLENDETIHISLLNYVLGMYNDLVKSSVGNLEIKHRREADILMNSVRLTPVEEVSMIMANTVSDKLVAIEVDIISLIKNDKYYDLLANLLITHQSRWLTDGYKSHLHINRILRSYGLFSETKLEVGDPNRSPLSCYTTKEEFYLHSSIYTEKEHAIHNYLFVNRLSGGMAVIGKDNDSYFLLSILPRGTRIVNTESTYLPLYVDEYRDPPIIYELEIVNRQLVKIAIEMGARPDVLRDLGEMGAIVVRQTYQRMIGASCNPENDDHYLVAMAELAKGAWSQEVGYKLLSMFHAWLSTYDDVTMSNYRESINDLRLLLDDDILKVAASTSASSCWSWVKLMNIIPGPDIDSDRVLKILKGINRFAIRGGSPTAIFNLSPKSLVSVKQMRGEMDMTSFYALSQAHLFKLPEGSTQPNNEENNNNDEEWYEVDEHGW